MIIIIKKNLNISDYHLFTLNFNFKNLKSIQILKKGNGISSIIQFDNYILRFINNSKKNLKSETFSI